MPRTARPKTNDPQVVDVLAGATMDPAFTPPPASMNPAAAVAPVVPIRPVPEAQLSPEQRRIRELEDTLAKERGRKDPEPELDTATPGADGNILIHFLEDGFTALGNVWYRGQELEFDLNGGAYADTRDRNGRSWLELRDDDMAQIRRYGKVMFRSGPWPGLKLSEADVAFESLKGAAKPSDADLANAERAEAARNRAAPRLPTR